VTASTYVQLRLSKAIRIIVFDPENKSLRFDDLEVSLLHLNMILYFSVLTDCSYYIHKYAVVLV
jgi:hypothetical protein